MPLTAPTEARKRKNKPRRQTIRVPPVRLRKVDPLRLLLRGIQVHFNGVGQTNFLLFRAGVYNRRHPQGTDALLNDRVPSDQEFKVDGAGHLRFRQGDDLRPYHQRY